VIETRRVKDRKKLEDRDASRTNQRKERDRPQYLRTADAHDLINIKKDIKTFMQAKRAARSGTAAGKSSISW